jgi:hypothetical protein
MAIQARSVGCCRHGCNQQDIGAANALIGFLTSSAVHPVLKAKGLEQG